MSGREVSTPERTYSGNFVTRIPSELHRRLAIEAAEGYATPLKRNVAMTSESWQHGLP
jgi:hypothetical protein